MQSPDSLLSRPGVCPFLLWPLRFTTFYTPCEAPAMIRFLRLLPLLWLAFALALAPLLAFDTPLSDTAVREAYFLGQRRDETMARFLEKYTVYLGSPRSGPHIASLTMFTPYALAVLDSRDKSVGYSAQQADLDNAAWLKLSSKSSSDSYGAYIPRPAGSQTALQTGLMPGPTTSGKIIR